MSSVLSRTSRAMSEIQRKQSFSWSEAAIDIRCRLLLSELEWQWTDLGLGELWTPVEEVHMMSEYPISDNTLCNACQQLGAAKGKHQPNGAALAQAAYDGCKLCNLVFDSLSKTRSDTLDIISQHGNPITFDIRDVDGMETLTAGYEDRFDHNGESRFFKALHPLAVLTEGDNSMYRGKPGTIEFIGHRIASCLLTHVTCPNTLEQPLPRRLIDVGRPGGDESHQPSLWINPCEDQTQSASAVEPPCGVYAALSYCWGSVPFSSLTLKTLEQLQEIIPIEKLPQTFKDAIEITRGLGIRYLWIDALCILQGESAEAKADWAQQSIQMDTIYNRAAIVLGVAASSTAYDGITCRPYHYHDIVEVQPAQVSPPTSSDDGVRRRFVASREFKPEVVVGPLHTRGWTFQERLLATRFVHLGTEKIFFECDHGREFEFYGSDVFQYQLGTRLGSNPHFELWHKLVEEYSQRRLTFAKDTLIALSGVAKQFAKRADGSGKYLAGLWEGNLVKDLLWCVKLPSERVEVAPSWSWGARRSEISYGRIRRHFCTGACAKVVSTDVTNLPAVYGYHCSGKVHVQGYLRKIFLHGERDSYQVVGFEVPREQSDGQDTKRFIGTCVMDFPNTERTLKRVADRFQHQEASGWENIFETWCLPLHLGRGILLQSIGQSTDEFERIGYFEYLEQHSPGNAMSKVEWASNCDPVSKAEYLADNPFRWFGTAIDSGQDDLIEDWIGDPEAIVTLV